MPRLPGLGLDPTGRDHAAGRTGRRLAAGRRAVPAGQAPCHSGAPVAVRRPDHRRSERLQPAGRSAGDLRQPVRDVRRGMTESRTAAHFQRLYEASPDPWGFASNPYEQAKYRETLLALGDRRFASGLEIGCSIGVLTRMLAPRCDALLGVDLVEQPLEAARARCADQPWVQFRRMRVPAEWSAGQFDLIVLSEVLYFLAPADIDHTGRLVRASLLPE